MYINELLNKYMIVKKLTKDSELAKELKVTRQYISNLRKGKTTISSEKIILIAEECKESSIYAVVRALEETTKCGKAKEIWREIIKKIE